MSDALRGGFERIVVIGGSAGSLDPLETIVKGLDDSAPLALFVVQHLVADAVSYLHQLLARHTRFSVFQAEHGRPFSAGEIHVAPPDYHLLVSDGVTLVSRGPRENRSRPAIDPLFRSAAVSLGPRVIGIVLTGMLDDGSAGLAAIERCGGTCIVQDPSDAEFEQMPRNALTAVPSAHSLPAGQIAPVILSQLTRPLRPAPPVPPDIEAEVRAVLRFSDADRDYPPGRSPVMSCPDCGGPLHEYGGTERHYRCAVGHAFSAESLLSGQRESVERAIWRAYRTVQERCRVLTSLAQTARSRGLEDIASSYESRLAEAQSDATSLRGLLIGPRSVD